MSVLHHDGADIHYDVRGTGSPILLVAGTGYAGATWHPRLLDGLAEHHAVITYDHRGTGASGSTDEDYTTELFGRDAVAVVEAAGLGPAHLIGHSMGGRVAQQAYFADASAVRSLTMAASGVGSAARVPFAQVGIPVGAVRAIVHHGFDRYITDKHRSNFFTEAFARTSPDEVAWLDEAYRRSAPTIDDYLKHIRARQAHSTADRFGQIVAPVLIVVGDADTHQGGTGSHLDGARLMHDLLPSARLEVIAGAKHGFMWESIEESLRVFLDFVDHVDSAATVWGSAR